MGLFGFVGSVVKGVAKGAVCVAAAPLVVGAGAVGAAVAITEEVIVPIGKGALKIGGALAKEILKNAGEQVANAYKYQQKGSNMGDSELLNAYQNATSQAEKVGYASALKERMNS